jgi:hypothetical protein
VVEMPAHYKIACLFAEACRKAATNYSALSGYAMTGICPCNPDIFSDSLFRGNKEANMF